MNPSDDQQPEEWRPIPGWEGYYDASSLGRIRSLDRIVHRRDGGHGTTRRMRGRVLKPGQDPDGHLRVVLCLNRKMHTKKVHRLVLEAFVGPCPEGMECCHNNGVPDDNRLTNLRWDTLSSNAFDRIKHGAHNMARRPACRYGHLFAGPNLVEEGSFRRCLSCQRARTARRRRGESHEWFLADADRRYEALMANVQDPLGAVTSLVVIRDSRRSVPVQTCDSSGIVAGCEQVELDLERPGA